VLAPFITGFWAYHQFPGYQIMHIIHIVSGEIMIATIPFTRLNHMLLGILTRIYMSSEFGGVKTARDW
jgi:nitrate reductase gamma subunit